MSRRVLGSAAPALFLACSIAGVAGCGGDETTGGVDGFTKQEWARIEKLSPLPETPQEDTTNKYADDAAAAKLGQMLFMDRAFSGPLVTGDSGLGKAGERGKVACVSCHDPASYMIDTHSKPNNTSIGANYMIRNASTVLNASYYKVWCENDGIRDSQWSDSLTDPEDATSMNGSRLLVAHVLYDKYQKEYDALFDDKLDPSLDPTAMDADRFPDEGKPGDPAWEMMTAADQKIVSRIYANFGKAIQAYIRKLVSRNAPFDKYVAGDHSAISQAAKDGLEAFINKANCIACHDGPLLSDSKFHDTGLDNQGAHVIHEETGRFDGVAIVLGCEYNSNSEYSDDQHSKRLDGLKQTSADKGAWRTKQLRNVAMTGPYMHTGQIETLEDVVKFYDDGGDPKDFIGTKDKLMKPLNLTADESANLVEFMKTLTGEPPSGELVANTAK